MAFVHLIFLLSLLEQGALAQEEQSQTQASEKSRKESKPKKESIFKKSNIITRDSGFRVRVIRSKKKEDRIKGLKLRTRLSVGTLRKPLPEKSEDGKVKKDKAESEEQKVIPFVSLLGRYLRPDWSLLLGKRKVKLSPRKKLFRKHLLVKKENRKIRFRAIGPKGETEEETIVLRFRDYLKFQENSQRVQTLFVTAGMGTTQVGYSDSRDLENLGYFAQTIKVAMRWVFAPPEWDMGVSGFFNVYPFTFANQSKRFLGLNFRGGYRFTEVTRPWSFGLMFGIYYVTMFVPDGATGFANLAGPQIFPVASYTIENGGRISGYFKFSPIADSFAILSLASHEIAFGTAYSFELGNGDALAITFDLSKINLEFSGVEIGVSTLSLGASYTFQAF